MLVLSVVLIFDSEVVIRGDELPHPVNYSLLRIIPPDGVEIDDRKRPISEEIKCLVAESAQERGVSAAAAV